MPINCPHLNCNLGKIPGPKNRSIVRYGSYFRSSDSRYIRRFLCKTCNRSFSHATLKPTYYQKKRRINQKLFELVSSGVSQRRAAKLLHVNRKTIVRRFRFLAHQARLSQAKYLEPYRVTKLCEIQFDDLETSEHTKCKPLSVALAVEPKSRKILNFKVNQMPAKGLLAKTAFRKYGKRTDERALGWDQMMSELSLITDHQTKFSSDDNPHYPAFVKKHHPTCVHKRVRGGRGAITGQGELKKLKVDPLFSLNHTCAMLRANLNRLFRRTWCTTKTKQGLIDHLSLYVVYHNQVLTPPMMGSTGLGAS